MVLGPVDESCDKRSMTGGRGRRALAHRVRRVSLFRSRSSSRWDNWHRKWYSQRSGLLKTEDPCSRVDRPAFRVRGSSGCGRPQPCERLESSTLASTGTSITMKNLKVTLDYGRTGLDVEVPAERVVGPLAIRDVPPLARPRGGGRGGARTTRSARPHCARSPRGGKTPAS